MLRYTRRTATVLSFNALLLRCERLRMKNNLFAVKHRISQVSSELWEFELEKASARYHIIACWVAAIFDPVFVFTDYINIPESWHLSLAVRLSVSFLILSTVALRKRFNISTYAVVCVPFILISLQNALTYSLIGDEDLLGHNLNYMALFIGAAMFVLWRWIYSAVIVVLSFIATIFFIWRNPDLDINLFFLNGGLLLAASAVFMSVLVQTRYNLTVKEIKTRLALRSSNEEIQAQAEEIKAINESLERQVQKRTQELEKKNKALEDYAFINAHKLRSPLASILGLVNLMSKTELDSDARYIMIHMEDSARKLDSIIGSISRALEEGDVQNHDHTDLNGSRK
jgi:signal transduction histidine kinase